METIVCNPTRGQNELSSALQVDETDETSVEGVSKVVKPLKNEKQLA